MNMSILFVSYVICTETNKYNFEHNGGSLYNMYVIFESRDMYAVECHTRRRLRPPQLACAMHLCSDTRATAEPLILQLQAYILHP